jgi:tRNA (cmo5U34)-methyltransferase
MRFMTSARRKSLYKEIFNIVTPGGCFINVDDMCAPSSALHKRYNAALNQWLEGYIQEGSGDTPQFVKYKEDSPVNYIKPIKDGFLDQELSSLREAGFEDVDCFWKFGTMTVYGGFRPEKPGLISSFARLFKS